MINDFVHFMKQFYMTHPLYKGREVYLGGIDFTAGLYIPFISRAMIDLQDGKYESFFDEGTQQQHSDFDAKFFPTETEIRWQDYFNL